MITFSNNYADVTLIRQNGKYMGWQIIKRAKGVYLIHNQKYPKKGWLTYTYKDARQCAISHLSKAS